MPDLCLLCILNVTIVLLFAVASRRAAWMQMAAVFALLLGSGDRSHAQSLDRAAAAPLQGGANGASVDSFIGPHYWYFWAQPGHFQVVFSQGAAEGLAGSGQASINCGFAPPTPGSHITVATSPSGAVFSGTVTQRTRVGIAVKPPNSMLIRSTVTYSVAASGDVVFDTLRETGPAVAGMYTPFFSQLAGAPPLGAVRFNTDGSIEAANGQTGSWRLFDKSAAVYVVTLAGQRMSLKFDPGRGLIDMRTSTIAFARSH